MCPVRRDDADLGGRPGWVSDADVACRERAGEHCSHRPPLAGAAGGIADQRQVIAQAVHIDEDNLLGTARPDRPGYLEHPPIGDFISEFVDDRAEPVLLAEHDA